MIYTKIAYSTLMFLLFAGWVAALIYEYRQRKALVDRIKARGTFQCVVTVQLASEVAPPP